MKMNQKQRLQAATDVNAPSGHNSIASVRLKKRLKERESSRKNKQTNNISDISIYLGYIPDQMVKKHGSESVCTTIRTSMHGTIASQSIHIEQQV